MSRRYGMARARRGQAEILATAQEMFHNNTLGRVLMTDRSVGKRRQQGLLTQYLNFHRTERYPERVERAAAGPSIDFLNRHRSRRLPLHHAG